MRRTISALRQARPVLPNHQFRCDLTYKLRLWNEFGAEVTFYGFDPLRTITGILRHPGSANPKPLIDVIPASGWVPTSVAVTAPGSMPRSRAKGAMVGSKTAFFTHSGGNAANHVRPNRRDRPNSDMGSFWPAGHVPFES